MLSFDQVKNQTPVSYGQQGQVITADQLQQVPKLEVPQSTFDNTQSDSLVAGVTAGIPSLEGILAPQQSELDTTQNAIIGRINDLLPQSGGKTQALAQEQQNQGLPQLQKQLQDFTNQINIGNAEYNKLALDAEAKKAALEANSKSFTSVVTGRQAAIDRQRMAERAVKAAELGMKAAQAQAITGNINTALKLAENAVAAKYAPIEDELRIRQAQLDAIAPLLDKEQKQRALKQQVLLEERNRMLQDQKEKEKTIQNIMIQAAQSGADQATLSRIQSSGNPVDAINAAGFALGAEFRQKVKQQEFENAMQKKQLAVSLSNLSLSRERLAFDKEKETFDQSFSLEQLKLDQTKAAFDQAQKLGGQATPQMQQALSKSNIDLIGSLLTHKGLNSSVGTNFLSRFAVADKVTGAKSDFIAGVEQLRSQLNLDTLIRAKGSGATFGALSDNELQVLASAASKLGTWAMKDDKGKIKGYDASEKDFRKELDKIQSFADLDYVLKGGNPDDVGIKQMPDGTYWKQNSDGSMTQFD